MNVIVKFITELSGEYLCDIVKLWKAVFNDSDKFILDVIASESYMGAAVAMYDNKIVGMAHLLHLESEKEACYCYAVATDVGHRGKGIGKSLMHCLIRKCKDENIALLLHPAEESLVSFYKKLGFVSLSYSYEINCQGDDGIYHEITSDEYKSQRDFLFGDKGYYGWRKDIVNLTGLKFICFEIDGEYMCAAVSESRVCELCAPPHMIGKATRRAANLAPKVLLTETNPIGADVAVMGYNVSEYSYFNLYFD